MGSSLLSSLMCAVLLAMVVHSQAQFIQNLKEKIKKLVAGGLRTVDGSDGHEEMLLFPDVGFQLENGSWYLNVHGWRFQKSSRNRFLGESSSRVGQRLARLLATSRQVVYYNDTFRRDRLKPFMVQGIKNEKILIDVGTKHNYTVHTNRDGRFYFSFMVPDDDVQELKEALQTDQVITYKATGDQGDVWRGTIHLLKRQGWSVISDIDDTIKISEVFDKIRLIANTFIHNFRVVEGMSEVYQGWKDKYNCSFHYLSAMPDQLYAVTKEFVDDHLFPDGSFHMRHFRWSSSSIFDFIHSVRTKTHKLDHLHEFVSNSLRKFILIGDSGEKDPEIYGEIARQYPDRIIQIYIRAVKGEPKDAGRFLKAFEHIPKNKWLIFTDPINELPADFPDESTIETEVT